MIVKMKWTEINFCLVKSTSYETNQDGCTHEKSLVMIIFTDEGSYKKEDLRVFNIK